MYCTSSIHTDILHKHYSYRHTGQNCNEKYKTFFCFITTIERFKMKKVYYKIYLYYRVLQSLPRVVRLVWISLYYNFFMKKPTKHKLLNIYIDAVLMILFIISYQGTNTLLRDICSS